MLLWICIKIWEMHWHYNMVDLLLIILFFLRGMEGKPSLWELDSNYSLHVGSNGDDSHAYDAWYKKLLSSVDLTKDFVLAAHTQLCKAYKGICLLMRLRGCHMKTCLFGIVLYVVANMLFKL